MQPKKNISHKQVKSPAKQFINTQFDAQTLAALDYLKQKLDVENSSHVIRASVRNTARANGWEQKVAA